VQYDYTFGDIFGKIKKHISLSSQFDTTQETQLKSILNSIHLEICNSIALPSLRKVYTLTTDANYSVGTAAATNGSTTVTMTTGVVGVPDDTWVGRQIRIAADAPYYTILEVSGNDLTIDQEYLGETDTGLAYTVFTLGYAMPRDFVIGREVDVRDTNQPFPISYLPWQDITRYDPSLVTYGPPLIYTFLPDEENREPEGTSTLTAESGTNTTTIVCTTLSSSVDDYYNNFVVINTTRGKTSLVTDYDGTTNTMTISPAIDAQTDTDVFYVIDMRAQFMPYPIPNDERSIVIEYLKEPITYRNDYDVPDIPYPLGGEDLLIHGTLARYFVVGDKFKQSNTIYQEKLRLLKTQYSRLYNAPLNKLGYGSRSFQRSMSLRIPYQIPY